MSQVDLMAFGLIALLAAYQLGLLAVFLIRTRAFASAPPECSEWPRACILIALKGADPDLRETLRRLVEQDYPQHDVHVVVDSENDPAWPIVADVLRELEPDNVTVEPLTHRPTSCSLHCASMVQLSRRIADDASIFVLCDSDAAIHERWLKELVRPIVTGDAAATTGNRWYAPPLGWFGSLFRCLMNATAVIVMYVTRAPWGGTLAGRVSDLRRSNLVDIWNRSLCVDAPLHREWDRLGLKIRFVPSLLIVNREESSLRDALEFWTRQVTWTRLYAPPWIWISIFGYSLLLPLVLGAISFLILRAALVGTGAALVLTLSGFLGYAAVNFGSFVLLERRALKVVAVRGDVPANSSVAWSAKTLACTMLSPFLNLACMLKSRFLRRLTWRGITYRIHGTGRVERL